jgi:CheY-like chemotaxis protein
VRRSAERPLRPLGDVSHRLGTLAGVRVLIVDDNADAREILKAIFEYCGASVFVAETGRAALRVFDGVTPHVVICDIAMPGWNGYRVLREIRALPRERGGTTPVIAVTAYKEVHHRERAIAAGFNAWLTKPANLAALITLVENVTTGRRLSAASGDAGG